MTSYNSPQNSAQEEKNYPSYYAITPAEVRYCKGLEPNAKLLYGEITALAGKEGYCWASNKYFADLYEVDERTVRRWIESLQNNNFILVEFETNTFSPKRKIYINKNFQKSFTEGQKCPTRTKMSGGEDKNVRPLNICNNTTENVVGVDPQNGGGVDEKAITKDDIYSMANRMKKDWSSEEIEKAWTKFKDNKYPVTDPFSYIGGIINKIRILNTSKEQNKCQKKTQNSQTQTQTQKTKCSESTSPNHLVIFNENSSEKDTSEHLLAKYTHQYLYRK